MLDAATSASDLHLYAHCLPGHPGGVTVLAINTNRTTPGSIDLPVPADRYTLSAEKLEDRQVQLNGRPLAMLASGGFPALDGSQIVAGPVTFAPASITFLAMAACGQRGLPVTGPACSRGCVSRSDERCTARLKAGTTMCGESRRRALRVVRGESKRLDLVDRHRRHSVP